MSRVVPVGIARSVRGRIDESGAKMEAEFDTTTSSLALYCRAKPGWWVEINFANVQQDHVSIPVEGSFGGDTEAVFEGHYSADTGVYRLDSPTNYSFWVEVDKDVWTNALEEMEEIIPWSIIYKEQAVLTLWPGTPVCENDRESLMKFFAEHFDIIPTIVGCVTTVPDKDPDGIDVPDTGGRHDFFFYVNTADVPKFAVPRLQFRMRWWEDVYFNDGQDIYPPAFLAAYPNPAE